MDEETLDALIELKDYWINIETVNDLITMINYGDVPQPVEKEWRELVNAWKAFEQELWYLTEDE